MRHTLADTPGLVARVSHVPGVHSAGQIAAVAARPLSDAMADGMLEMAIAKDNGLDHGVGRTPRHAVDTSTTFRQWCEEILKPAMRGA
jgi:hypothetical protein